MKLKFKINLDGHTQEINEEDRIKMYKWFTKQFKTVTYKKGVKYVTADGVPSDKREAAIAPWAAVLSKCKYS